MISLDNISCYIYENTRFKLFLNIKLHRGTMLINIAIIDVTVNVFKNECERFLNHII